MTRAIRWVALLLGAVSTVLSAWIGFVLAHEARDTFHDQARALERARAQTNTLVTAGLSTAMFERDYGRTQELLSHYLDAHYLTRAAVTNNDMVVVAIIGSLPDVRIGAKLPAQLASDIRRLPLRMRSERVGELIYIAGAIEIDADAPQAHFDTMAVAAEALAVAALLAFLAFCTSLRSRRDGSG